MRDRTAFRPTQLSFSTFPTRYVTKLMAVLIFPIAFAAVSLGQTQTPAQTPYLFASAPISNLPDGIVVMLRDPHSGVLTLVSTAPSNVTNPCVPETMEPQGQFLFGVCGDGLAMYTFNGMAGSVQEVAHSPFSASAVTGLYGFLVAPESTGQFVYLLKFSEPTPPAVTYELDRFQIDRTTPQLIPLTSQLLPFGSSLLGAAADPNGHGIAIVTTQPDPVTPGATVPAAFFITFNPTTGAGTIPTSGTTVPGTDPTAFALSSQGKFFALGSTTKGFNVAQVSYTTLFALSTNAFAITGTPLTIDSPAAGPTSTAPIYLNFDPLGGLLYVQYANTGIPPQGSPFEIYQLPALTPLGTIPFTQGNIAFGGIADPDATYRYEIAPGSTPQGLAVWVIDPGTGIPSQPPSLTNPFFPSLNLNPRFANYVSSGGGQNLSGPFLSQSTTALTFGSTTTGTSSAPQTVTLNSVGGQPVSLVTTIISGTNASDFGMSGSCLTTALLQPQTSCPLVVTYSPLKVGASAAIITITGNSPTSPQTISLSGTAVAPPAPAPVASFSTPNPFTLPGTTTQGTSSSPQAVNVSNTGTAPLHISTVVLAGFNSSDYSLAAAGCSGTVVAANSSCTMTLTFSPSASGFRTASATVNDDAANSPQVLSIIGDAVPAVSISAATGSSTSLSVAAGQTAQFNLTATPGAGFNGTLTFGCSGVPFGAMCTVPQSVTVSNGAPASFTVSVTTASASVLAPQPTMPPVIFGRPGLRIFVPTLLAFLALFFAVRGKTGMLRLAPLAVSALLLALLISSGIGCGGGTTSSAITQPPPQTQAVATPSLSPNGGTFSTSYPTVTMSDSTPGAVIHYTTGGSAPTASSTTYLAPVTLTSAGTVQAMATASGYTASPVATASFKLQTASGTYTITVTPTAVASGSTTKLQMNPIALSLTVK